MSAAETIRTRIDQHAAVIDRNLRPIGPNVTDRQRFAAENLALAWLDAAEASGVTLDDLDMVASLASTALDAVRCRDRRLERAS